MANQSFTRDFKVVVGEDRNKFDNIEVPGGLQDCGGAVLEDKERFTEEELYRTVDDLCYTSVIIMVVGVDRNKV